MRAIEAGESFIVTRNGVPLAELTPLRRRRRSVPREEFLRAFRNLPPIDAEQFFADIDEGFDQSIEPRG